MSKINHDILVLISEKLGEVHKLAMSLNPKKQDLLDTIEAAFDTASTYRFNEELDLRKEKNVLEVWLSKVESGSLEN